MSNRYGEIEAGLAAIPENYQQVYDYYGLGFSAEGLPGRLENGVWKEHPMYSTYLIRDYLFTYAKMKEDRFLRSAELVAERALKRMTLVEEALVYYYCEHMVSTLFEGKFYSALTQSNYVTQFVELFKASGRASYLKIAKQIFKSLLIPKEKGGVLFLTDKLCHVEEYPSSPVLWTLNGWITAVQNVYKLYEALGDPEVKEFCIENVKSIEKLLPIYDLGSIKNTRYQLSGFFYMKIVVSGEPVNITSGNYFISDKEEYRIQLKTNEERKSRWGYNIVKGITNFHGENQVTSSALFNVVGSLASSSPNRVTFNLSSQGVSNVKLFMAQGEYDPLLTAMPTQKWELLEELNLSNKAEFKLSVDIPNTFLSKAIYPTNFKKKIGGKNYNAYHFIHIEKLEQILTWYQSEVIAKYVDRWRQYVSEWPNMELYKNSEVEFSKYGSK